MPFDFEEFPVYKDTLKFVEEIDRFLETIPAKVNLRLIDQLQRAAISIVLNIAEGAGRFHKADKRNFYIMSRGSVYECAACIQIFLNKRVITQDKYDLIYTSLNGLAKQLSAMVK